MSNPFAKTYDDLRRPYLEGKMAKKDYDGDGKVETGTQEYMGSRDKAIKKAMGKDPKQGMKKEENYGKYKPFGKIHKVVGDARKKVPNAISKKVDEHHQKDADGNPIEHGDGTPSNVEDTYTSAYLDELSKKTLGSYVNKASKETKGNMVATQHGSGIPKKAKDIKLKQVNKRLKGMAKAGEKLAKEETVNEISMPKNTSYEKMSYKKLKKTHSDFKNMDSKPPRVSVLDKKTGGTVSKPVKFVPDKKPKMKEEYQYIEKFLEVELASEGTLGTLHFADYKGNTPAWQNRMGVNKKGKRLYSFGQDLIQKLSYEYPDDMEMIEAKDTSAMKNFLDKKAKKLEADKKKQKPEYRNNPAFGDPSHHSNKKIKSESYSDWRSEFVWEDGDSAKKLEEAKADKDKPVKEGGVKNKITINPVVQVESQQQIDENPLAAGAATILTGLGIKTAYDLYQKNKNPEKIRKGSTLDQLKNKNAATQAAIDANEYKPEGEMLEDAKMGRMSDSDLAAAHKKFSSMDQTSPANKFMTKRISKEMNRRKKKVSEGFYQKRYAGVGKGYETVGKNKRMDKSNKRSGDSKKQYRELHQDLAKKEETLLTQVASAYVDEATRMKKEMGYNKGGTKKPTGPKPKDAALDAVKKSITAKYGKGAIMSGGSRQQKKVKGQKTGGGGKFKMMADKKKKTAADAKEMGYGKNVKGYIETRARYGSKANMKAGKGLGT